MGRLQVMLDTLFSPLTGMGLLLNVRKTKLLATTRHKALWWEEQLLRDHIDSASPFVRLADDMEKRRVL